MGGGESAKSTMGYTVCEWEWPVLVQPVWCGHFVATFLVCDNFGAGQFGASSFWCMAILVQDQFGAGTFKRRYVLVQFCFGARLFWSSYVLV